MSGNRAIKVVRGVEMDTSARWMTRIVVRAGGASGRLRARTTARWKLSGSKRLLTGGHGGGIRIRPEYVWIV